MLSGFSKAVLIGMVMVFGVSSLHAGEAGKNRKKKERREGKEDTVIDFIFEHEKELRLQPEQRTKLNNLQRDSDKLLDSPAVREAQMKLKRAKKDRNDRPEEFMTARKAFKEKIKEAGGSEDALSKILFKEQIEILNKLLAKEAGGPADAGDVAPNPFE